MTGSASSRLSLQLVAPPEAGPADVLVDMMASSLNRGEIPRLAAADEGTVPGWDVAGVVSEPSADGSGPPVGARVLGLVRSGAWAERVAVPVGQLAQLPDEVTFEQAAAIPVAGLTALGTLRAAAARPEHRLLITAASGGVGGFTVQLALAMGCSVSAVARTPERAELLSRRGARALVGRAPAGEEFDVILDSVGGACLGRALAQIAAGGTLIAYGNSSGEPTMFDVPSFYGRAPGSKMLAYTIFDDIARSGSTTADLADLAERVADGHLDPDVALTTEWAEIDRAIDLLMARELTGKVVLRIR